MKENNINKLIEKIDDLIEEIREGNKFIKKFNKQQKRYTNDILFLTFVVALLAFMQIISPIMIKDIPFLEYLDEIAPLFMGYALIIVIGSIFFYKKRK